MEGELTNSKGDVLRMNESTRQKIVPERAMGVIEKYAEMSELSEIMSLPKGKLLKFIGDKFPPDEKSARRAGFLLELQEAGAIQESKAHSIEIERKQDGK